jgi:uncharacterized membrane protein
VSEEGLPDLAKPFVDAVESLEVVEQIGERVGRTVRSVIPEGPVKDALSGTWIGHALHPLLTDVVIGSFISATMLDLLGGDASGRARERLIAIGIAAYLPTALTGANDYAEAERSGPAIRRVGVVHAATNSLALAGYASSLRSRRRGRTTRAKLQGLLGAAALGAAGHLGGHMTYTQGVGVES